MIAAATALLLACGVLAAFVRLVTGPTLHDRAMAAQAGLLCAALWLAAQAVVDGRAAWLDAALALALCDFILAVAFYKAFRARSLQTALARPRSGQGS